MTDAHGIARNTAKRLAPIFGEALPLTVQKVIHGAGAKPGQFDLGAVAALAGIATLIVQCAQFAFDWRKSRGSSGGKDEIEALKRELRLMAAKLDGVSEKDRDAVIEAVAKETGDEGEV
jgi:hypothetical protein